MAENEGPISKVVMLTGKLLSGWRVLTVKDATALAASLLTQRPDKKQGN